MVRLAEIAGFVKIAARFGMTPTQTQRCLADGKGLQRLLNRTQAAQDAGITHTPTFLIDGNSTDASTWDELDANESSSGRPLLD